MNLLTRPQLILILLRPIAIPFLLLSTQKLGISQLCLKLGWGQMTGSEPMACVYHFQTWPQNSLRGPTHSLSPLPWAPAEATCERWQPAKLDGAWICESVREGKLPYIKLSCERGMSLCDMNEVTEVGGSIDKLILIHMTFT